MYNPIISTAYKYNKYRNQRYWPIAYRINYSNIITASPIKKD